MQCWSYRSSVFIIFFLILRVFLAYCSSLLCIIVKSTATTTSTTVKHKTNPATTQRSTSVEKHLFPLAKCCPSSKEARARKQSRNMDSRSQEKPEKRHCSLSRFLCYTQSAFLYDSVLTSVATSHSGLDLLTSIISHDNVQQTCWQTNVVQPVPYCRSFFPVVSCMGYVD